MSPAAEYPELPEALSFEPGVDQKIALHAPPAARDYAFEFLRFQFIQSHFSYFSSSAK